MFKSIIITGALVLAVPALAQDGLGKQASNFILGHGALAPQTTSSYPPGHQVDGGNLSLPAASSEKPETRASERK